MYLDPTSAILSFILSPWAMTPGFGRNKALQKSDSQEERGECSASCPVGFPGEGGCPIFSGTFLISQYYQGCQ